MNKIPLYYELPYDPKEDPLPNGQNGDNHSNEDECISIERYLKIFAINSYRIGYNLLLTDLPFPFLGAAYKKLFLLEKGVPFSTSIYSEDNNVAMKHYPEQKVLKKYEPPKEK